MTQILLQKRKNNKIPYRINPIGYHLSPHMVYLYGYHILEYIMLFYGQFRFLSKVTKPRSGRVIVFTRFVTDTEIKQPIAITIATITSDNGSATRIDEPIITEAGSCGSMKTTIYWCKSGFRCSHTVAIKITTRISSTITGPSVCIFLNISNGIIRGRSHMKISTGKIVVN